MMTEKELGILIGYIFAGYGELSDVERSRWQDTLASVSFSDGMKFARELASRKVYGRPKPEDISRVIDDARREARDSQIVGKSNKERRKALRDSLEKEDQKKYSKWLAGQKASWKQEVAHEFYSKKGLSKIAGVTESGERWFTFEEPIHEPVSNGTAPWSDEKCQLGQVFMAALHKILAIKDPAKRKIECDNLKASWHESYQKLPGYMKKS